MANLKELRGRIKSVSNIAQITKAMEMVASMKLRKVQGKAQANRPYTEEIRAMVEHLASGMGNEIDEPLFQVRDVKNTAVFLITSDRGLCGSYNANMLSAFQRWDNERKAAHPDRKVTLYCYGKKGYSFLSRRDYEVARFFAEPPLDKADFSAAKMVSKALVDGFLDGSHDEVVMGYTEFTSTARFTPKIESFLPVQSIEGGQESETRFRQDYILEPDADVIFGRLIPRYLETVIYDAMIQSMASEHASRRMAMKGATDSATDMSKGLKKVYNRARQETITKELLDIIGGANAVS
ncbi:MAG: ATP synthase F1 subunit gamma [Myxococcota bacterium]